MLMMMVLVLVVAGRSLLVVERKLLFRLLPQPVELLKIWQLPVLLLLTFLSVGRQLMLVVL